jgi:hypothetical protein
MRVSFWLMPAALLACAKPVQWEKSGASERVTEADTQECRLQTRLSPQSRATPELSGSPAKMVGGVQEQRAREDADLFQKCMEDKGYAARR